MFKGFRKPEAIEADTATSMLSNVSGDEYILYTGGKYAARRASGRSACLSTVTTAMKPMALTTYAKRCLTASADGKGYPTSISVGGLSLHQGAKPAVYLHLVRDDKGNLVAKKAIPCPDKARFPEAYAAGGFKAGDIVVAAKATGKAVAKASGKRVAAGK